MSGGGEPRGALLVGGLNLPTAEDVFRTVGATLGDRLESIPDGETGPRVQWIIWQLGVLAHATGLERVPPPEMYGPWDRFQAAPGATAAAIELGELGYARDALQSYGVFRDLKARGAVPEHARLQISLPPPVDVVTVFATPETRGIVETAYEAAMVREVARIAAGIPAAELAIQWDVCWEIAFLEGIVPHHWDGDALDGIAERLTRLGALVPAGAALGYHLCYGSYRNEHFLEPRDTEVMTHLANAIAREATRSIDWVHMPVPRERDDAAYVAPLADLQLADDTRLHLGLVHLADGEEGTAKRIATALEVVPAFGVASECGLSRVPTRDIEAYLRLHAAVCEPLASPARHPRARTSSVSADLPVGVHLVGSVPLSGPEEVMRTAANVLPEHLKRITDGETGPRENWIGSQFPILAQLPQLEGIEPPAGHYGPPVVFRLREDAAASDIELPSLGYAEAARASWEDFAYLADAEIVPAHWRFQVSLPTPLATTIVALELGSRSRFEEAYAEAMLRELREILAALPHDRLAIQWDVCQEVGLWEGFYDDHTGTGAREHVRSTLIGLAAAVPRDVELGFHLCYGDFEHRHFSDPRDASTVVEIAGALLDASPRPVDYIHMPVPLDADTAYFAPLKDLPTPEDTELYLGLVHDDDGVSGARGRIDAARSVVDRFGIATECGLGRRPPAQVGDLLRLHRELAAPGTR